MNSTYNTTSTTPPENPVHPVPPSPPVPTGYQQTEVGVIPEDWILRTYGEVFDFLPTASLSRGELSTEEHVSYVHYGDIHVQWSYFLDFKVSSLPTVGDFKAKKYTLLKDGDLIMADASEDYSGIGKSVEVKNIEKRRAISGLHTFLLRDSKNTFVNGFKGYIHSSLIVKSSLDRLATGLKVYGISKGNLRSVQIPIPPFTEQRAIAQALSDTDALIQSLDQLIAKKRLIKQGAMQQLLKPKPGWKLITFEEAFDFLSTASYSRSDLKIDEEIGYIHYGDIHTLWNSFLDFKHNVLPTVDQSQLNRYNLIKEGDLIMADASEDYEGVGKSIEIKNLGNRKAISGLHTFLLRDRNDHFINGYKGYISSSEFVREQFKRLATGLKVYGVSKGNLRGIEIPLPTKEEQKAIALTLSDMDAEIAALEAKRDKYRQIKQGMMQQLLTGKIRLV